jgi:hypothetical protein
VELVEEIDGLAQAARPDRAARPRETVPNRRITVTTGSL